MVKATGLIDSPGSIRHRKGVKTAPRPTSTNPKHQDRSSMTSKRYTPLESLRSGRHELK